jgi:hypothetical protein
MATSPRTHIENTTSTLRKRVFLDYLQPGDRDKRLICGAQLEATIKRCSKVHWASSCEVLLNSKRKRFKGTSGGLSDWRRKERREFLEKCHHMGTRESSLPSGSPVGAICFPLFVSVSL